jgi:copper chaperone NosL
MRDRRALVALVLCAAAACRSIPDEPTAIAYDRAACAHCHMLIGDPRYAAQLVTESGDVLDFDDPGCALRYLAETHAAVHRLWFRDPVRDRWLAAAAVRFVPGAHTPMGYGLAAAPGATPHALTLDQATAVITRGAP